MSQLLPFFLFALSTTFTPGPNNIMMMNSGMHFGLQKSLPHFLGICLGFPLMVLTVALGMGAIFIQYEWLRPLLKIIGSAYMLYLAFQILTSHTKSKLGVVRKPFNFIQAILFQWINPKAWLMAISTMSIFTLSLNYFNNAALISLTYFLMGVPCIGCWLLFGKFLQRILKKDSQRVWFNMMMALSLVASIGMIWIE